MIPGAVAEIARRRVAIELEQRRKSAGAEVQHIYHEATKPGALQSGRTLVQVREYLNDEYRTRAAVVLGVWRRALASAGVAPTMALGPDLIDEIGRAVE